MMHGFDDRYGMMGGYNTNNGLSFIIILILLGIIGYAIFKILGTRTKQSDKQALDILKTKLVNGEITEDEYLRRKKIINK